MIMPRADPETAWTDPPFEYAIGLLLGVGGILTPVEATVATLGLATPDGQTVTVTVLKVIVSKWALTNITTYHTIEQLRQKPWRQGGR